ncbi:MAG: MFS transporter [Firmicutes bacterium]|nr:MFS transporter [Bacillota bacterium]
MFAGLDEKKRDFLLFCLSGALLGVYSGLYDPSFNNYLNDTFHVSESVRGGLELFRELPGFLVVIFSGLLMFLADARIAVVSLLVLSLGLFGQGFMAPSLGWAVLWMVMWSVGAHLFLPVQNSIVVGLVDSSEVGSKLGLWSGINTAASLVGYVIVFAGFRYFHLGYRFLFGMAALAALVAGVSMLMMKPRQTKRPRMSLVIKGRYRLYYILCVLFGARKQIFITFGPWVLIKVFNQPVTTFAVLGMVGTVLGVFFKPALGRMIDKVGERRIIMLESLGLVVVCLGYGFARDILPLGIAMLVVYACFVGDNLLFACNMARATYINKIIEDRQDLTPTLSMGVTVDHAVSMTVPFFAGMLWELMGFHYVFLVASLLALLNFWAATRIRVDTGEAPV